VNCSVSSFKHLRNASNVLRELTSPSATALASSARTDGTAMHDVMNFVLILLLYVDHVCKAMVISR
jgi:hypothetical protein